MLTKVGLVKAMVFPVVMYGCESWTVKKAERRRIDAFEPWCWRRLLRVPWTAKVGSQETPGVTGKFGLGIWNEAEQRLIEFCQENALVIVNTLFQQHKTRLDTWHHQMVNTKIRLIIFFVAKDGEALHSQQQQDQELTVEFRS